MIEITETNVSGFKAAIRGMRNPLESWAKSDSRFSEKGMVIGPEDRKLMKKLAAAGNDHGKFMRMLTVTCDIYAPLYWWKEFDTYKVGTVANSCSTMHKIHAHEFTRKDFSYDLLTEKCVEVLDTVIAMLNEYRVLYNETKDKAYWWGMIQLLPSSYNQKRTVQLNYAVLKNMYHARSNHKLDEWHVFCKWMKLLPLADLIIE